MTSKTFLIRTQYEWAVLLTLAVLLGGGWILLSKEEVAAPTGAETLTEAPIVGHLAPDFVLETALGETVQLSNLRGQPVVLNFWASWCGPCRFEMPDLQRASMKYNGRSVILGVNQGESNRTIIDFGNEFGISYPLLNDQDQAINREYMINSLPTTVFIDSSGIVHEVQIGIITEAVLEDRIEALLKE